MRSTLDPNVANVPRHAEASDARLAIREHEDQPKRKKEQERRDPIIAPEDLYDQASIAVSALVDFLREFLKTLDQPAVASAPSSTAATPPDQAPVQEPVASALNPDAARAAHAYQHTAQAQVTGQILQPGAGAVAQTLLHTTEVRQIHALISKLNTLQNRGISAIKLERADSFLNALDIAADHALGSP